LRQLYPALAKELGELFRFSDIIDPATCNTGGPLYKEERFPVGQEIDVAVENMTKQIKLVYRSGDDTGICLQVADGLLQPGESPPIFIIVYSIHEASLFRPQIYSILA
jgi:hypothetical protein